MSLRKLFLTLVICFLASNVYAEFEMSTGVRLRLEYDDNIYLDSNNEEDDIITTVTPSVDMKWETPRLDLSLLARVSMEKYMDNTDEDRIGAGESTQSSSLNALARLYRDMFFLRVSDSYSRVPIDEGGRSGENNRTVNLTDSNRLQINPYLQFELMKNTQMRLGYTYENLWYQKSAANAAINHLYSASLTRELSPKVAMTLSGAFEQYRPKSPSKAIGFGNGGTYEYDQKNASLGLSYQATERFQLQAQYGHSWLNYDVRSDSDSNVWSASADYEITSDYTVGTAYSRSYVVSANEGPSESDQLSAFLEYAERFIVNFTLFARSRDYVEINRTDDSYGGQLSGELPFNDKTGVTGLFRYTNFDRNGPDADKYDRYSGKFSLYYQIMFGRVSAGYIYNRNDSDLNNSDYTNNIVFLNASLRF